jgi:quercetin dioxygenase-like cupin family protein
MAIGLRSEASNYSNNVPAATSLRVLSRMRCTQYAWTPVLQPEQTRSASCQCKAARSCTPDIKPENPPERAAHYVDVPNMPWEETKFPGMKIKVLYTDASGITTALFKLEPGAVVPLHEHTALEQTYVIEGSLEDHEGKCGPGQFVWRPAGNQHEAVAPKGAMLLGFFLKPNRFAYGEKFFTAAGER